MQNFKAGCWAGVMLALLTGCSDESVFKSDKKPAPPPNYLLYSPNGEPLNGGALGKPTCEVALSKWFDRTAQNGAISKTTFMADAETQFSKMDIDRNGYLVPEELDRFRAPYRQEPVFVTDKDDSEKKGQHKKKGESSGEHKQTNSSGNLFDPVMSADMNLDFRVTREEFITQAGENFSKLDSNHDGVLNRDEVLVGCKAEKEKR